MQIVFTETPEQTGSVVVAAYEKGVLSSAARRYDEASDRLIKRAVALEKYEGKSGILLDILAPAGLNMTRLLLLGAGKQEEDLDKNAYQKWGAQAIKYLMRKHETVCYFDVKGFATAEQAAEIAFGASLASYRFDKYKTKIEEEKKPSLKKIVIVTSSKTDSEQAYKKLAPLADGVTMARNLVSEPPNILYPASYAKQIKELTKLGLSVDILGEKEMSKLGFGSLLAVGMGSEKESQLVVMRWNGGGKDAPCVAFVGKGVTFDTGGISLKPPSNMDEMKGDMGGSATVVGVMQTLAGRKSPVNAIGVVGLVENMPDGCAQRPGDIVTSLSGQTIEVLNTDAEGRLVLADALWYVQEKYNPEYVIDLATLTGAIIIALGYEHAGVFTNSDALAESLTLAGKKSGETVWRLPLGKAYDKRIDSDIADIKNIGAGRDAGSILAAQFLQRFIQENVKWAHIDIAGVAWKGKSLDPREPSWSTGYGVRLLNQWVEDTLETHS